ncbi:glycerate kinase type-2 family protein [Rhodothermus profundi]|uniref:Glycerate 2-kinase n=1 Tax=Rhodothermus profundi TaxID=633813 RepID=A0A1M6SDI0_9BACT|nr:glycerate kinase [Rhodothermus profundi]SHK42803.1 glycerate 2-kinase [Rhodothermus profundi]
MPYQDGVADAQAIFRAAVRGAQADVLLTQTPWTTWTPQRLDRYRRIVVVGMGKAAMAMAGMVEQQLTERIGEGLVVVPHGYAQAPLPHGPAPQRIPVMEAGHPVPDKHSVQAARRILELAAGCTEDDLLLVLISGGGSALCTDFEPPVTLADAQHTFRLLLESGADIYQMNTVRKHLSRIGGGRLAQAAAPADVLALVISDVVGDDLSVIASGPTVPDPTTFAEAIAVLRRFGLWHRVPASVRTRLEAGVTDPSLETPKPADPRFARVVTRLIGTNRRALEAAADEARQRGYSVRIVTDRLTGEAREVAPQLVAALRDVRENRPVCLLWGGETTVTVRGRGRGGRNQELALAAALAMEGWEASAVLLSGGTDGRDGPTDAAGAWTTPDTASRARSCGLDPQAYLEDNNAYAFFEALEQLLFTGPTHTNVMDVQVGLRR